jgi:DNA-binding Lrp family transcriptional regulator
MAGGDRVPEGTGQAGIARHGRVTAFEEHVADIPNVLQAQRLFGDPDYLLHVVARDLPACRQLYDERLATLSAG